MGEEKTPLTIHTAVLKGLSDPLNAMIHNGTMRESTSRVAVLEDVEVEIFTAFCEYAYRSNFAFTRANYVNQGFPMDTEVAGGQSHESVESEDSNDSDDSDEIKKHEKDDDEGVSRWGLELCLDNWDFVNHEFQRDSRWVVHIERTEFIFSVRVYVFATRYLIEPLRHFCLRHLHDKLCDTLLTVQNSHRILDLLEYTYLHTSSKEPSGKSLMRELVIHYVACKFDILSKNEDFDRLLRSNADIGADLFMSMSKWKRKRRCKCKCYEC